MDNENTAFARAVDFVTRTNEPLFLTGRAGTGKTTFLRYIRTHCGKQCAVVAPTGVAAMNAGGETIHSFLQLPFSPFVPGTKPGYDSTTTDVQDKHTMLANLRMNEVKKKLIRKLELLIIDEVSMVRADVLDAIDLVLRHVRRNYSRPFGGLQMVFIGDPFQLPPVIREEEWEILRQFYPGVHFFDSWAIRQNPPVYIELQKVYRQRDPEFVGLLNRVRNGETYAEDIKLLNSLYDDDARTREGYVVLCTHNHIADGINQQELAEIENPEVCFEAIIKGDVNDRNIPGEKQLRLKKGAQVMFIKNDLQTPRRYYNGKIGVIHSIDTAGIVVACNDGADLIPVEMDTWRSVRYTLNMKGNIEEEELGSFTQYPIRLAWAVTIHKSQGLTLEKVIIDAGRAFAAGQVYVALSRCTTLEGIILRSRLHDGVIMTDERVIAFAALQQDDGELDTLLEEGEQRKAADRLMNSYTFADLNEQVRGLLTLQEKRKTGPRDESITLLTWMKAELEAAIQNAEKFGRQLHSMIGKGDHDKLPERAKAASEYFCGKVLQECVKRTEAHIMLYNKHPKLSRQVSSWTYLLRCLQERIAAIQSASDDYIKTLQ